MYKTILFDLDDTILDFRKSEAIALRKTLVWLNVEPSDESVELYSEINAKYWRMLEDGKYTRTEIVILRFDEFLKRMGIECSGKEVNNIYTKYLAMGHYFLPGAKELIESLYKDYDLYIVSNGTPDVQEGRIKSSGITKYFKKIFISEKIGYDKPTKEFFDKCFEQMPGAKKEEMIIIGDSLTSDIKGGNNAGIATCWYNPHHKNKNVDVKVDYEIDRLEDIYTILK